MQFDKEKQYRINISIYHKTTGYFKVSNSKLNKCVLYAQNVFYYLVFQSFDVKRS